MSAPAPTTQESTPKTRGFARRLLPLLVILAAAAAVYLTLGQGMISLESLVQHRAAIDAFVMSHRLLAVLAYIALYTGRWRSRCRARPS